MEQSMDTNTDRLSRCITTVAALNHTHHWGLTPQLEHSYATAILPYMPLECPDSLLSQIAWCYHHDHHFVTALLDGGSLEGQGAWQRCRNQLPALLHYAQLRWDIDSSADQEDLYQVGAIAIFQALPQFHYHSRFSTWMYQVFRHSVLRVLRDRKAGKRYAPTDSYDEHPDLEPTLSAVAAVESTAQFNILVALIEEILAGDRDQRLQQIFQLWAFNDARLADIGRITKLSQSRVSILLEQARERLRQDPRMQEWHGVLPGQIPSADSSSPVDPPDADPSNKDDPPRIHKDTN